MAVRVIAVLLTAVVFSPADVLIKGILTNTPGGQTHTCVTDSTLFALQGTGTWFVTAGWQAAPNETDTFDFPPYPAYPESIAVAATFDDTVFIVLEIPHPSPAAQYSFPTPYRRITVQFALVSGVADERPLTSSAVLAVNPSLAAGAATIRATVPGRLEILDATGTTVRSYSAPAEIVWYGDNATGEKLSPGIYFCRLITDSGSTVRKIVLQ
ncbi:MAG: T9SS type A sorting domain-containing protein [candidate division WOR-3 bacterium]